MNYEVMAGTAPDIEFVAKFSEDEKKFLQLLEQGVQTSGASNLHGTGIMSMLNGASGQVYKGKPAMTRLLAKITRRQADPSQPDPRSLLRDLEPTFLMPWMLTLAQLEEMKGYKAENYKNSRASISEALVPLADTSVRAACDAAASQANAVKKKASPNKNEQEDEAGLNLDKLFRSRKKRLV